MGFAALSDAPETMKTPDGKNDAAIELGAVLWLKTVNKTNAYCGRRSFSPCSSHWGNRSCCRCRSRLKRIDAKMIPRAGIVSAALFVSSLIHINIGPTSAHLVLNGIGGLILGMGLFPHILLLSFFRPFFSTPEGCGARSQYMHHESIWRIGRSIRTICLILASLPGLPGLCWSDRSSWRRYFTALALAGSGEVFFMTAKLILLAHIPIMGIESLIGAFVAAYVFRTMPSLLEEWEKWK